MNACGADCITVVKSWRRTTFVVHCHPLWRCYATSHFSATAATSRAAAAAACDPPAAATKTALLCLLKNPIWCVLKAIGFKHRFVIVTAKATILFYYYIHDWARTTNDVRVRLCVCFTMYA